MQIEWIETFLTAAREENFRRTAECLHLAQPTVTQHIRKLEEHVGVPLFHRIGQHVELSSSGQRFLADAEKLRQVYTDGLENLARWRQGYTSRVTVAVSPLIATSYLPKWIQGFNKIQPDVEFVIKVMESGDVVDCLRDHQADVGFTRSHSGDSPLDALLLYEDDVVMVAPATVQNIDGPPLDASVLLAEHVLFTHCHPDYWPLLLRDLRQVQSPLRTMVVSQVHVAVQWISDGLGVSFLPRSAVHKEILRGNLEEVQFRHFALPRTRSFLVVGKRIEETAQAFARYVEAYSAQRNPL